MYGQQTHQPSSVLRVSQNWQWTSFPQISLWGLIRFFSVLPYVVVLVGILLNTVFLLWSRDKALNIQPFVCLRGVRMLWSWLSCLIILTYRFPVNSKTGTRVRTVSVGERYVVEINWLMLLISIPFFKASWATKVLCVNVKFKVKNAVVWSTATYLAVSLKSFYILLMFFIDITIVKKLILIIIWIKTHKPLSGISYCYQK